MVSYSFDLLNRLTSITSVNGQSATLDSHGYLYNNANQRTSMTNADNSYWIYQYDTLGQVTSGIKYWSDGTPVAGQQFGYLFDSIGNRQSTTAGGDQTGANLRSATYSANNLNQYSSRTVPNAVDIIGSATNTATVTVNGQLTYRKNAYYRLQLGIDNSAGALFQPVTNLALVSQGSYEVSSNFTGNVFLPKSPETFSHDLDGNLSSDGRWTYSWDAENRLVSLVANTAVGPQQSIKFEYDARGRRIGKKVWNNTAFNGTPALEQKFLYDGWNLSGVLNSSFALQTSFIWGSDLSGSMQGAGGVGGLLEVSDAVNGVHFVAHDGNGNVTALAKAADGTLSAQYEYGPFGEVVRATGPMAKANPFRFSTKYQDDETDLLYYGYRYYNAGTGRWFSRDPVASESGGANLYGLAANDVIDNYDVLGGWMQSGYEKSWSQMYSMLSRSKEEFRKKLYALCPSSMTASCSGAQRCTPESCHLQADLLTLDFAAYLEATFAAQYARFGNVLAFTPLWLPIETINDRANKAPNKGMIWIDYSSGFGLKCYGMQDLMTRRFDAVIRPLAKAGMQCFKAAKVGNSKSSTDASHHWLAIYSISNDDLTKIDVHVDPWFSAGGIISPERRGFGEAQYFDPILW